MRAARVEVVPALWGLACAFARGLRDASAKKHAPSYWRLIACTVFDYGAMAWGVFVVAAGAAPAAPYAWATVGPMIAVAFASSVGSCDAILAKVRRATPCRASREETMGASVCLA
jgi:hypothetical protein